jgi:type I restriction enzyme S subunit
LLRSPAYKARIKASSTGVVESRLRLYSDDLGRIEALVPPPDEQAAIVRFLDWANGRLERAIRAKRKVIALLGEQKQAIIHRAVTRGLDPSVPLKPSGIPWLGDIPEHWTVSRVKNEFRCLNTQRVPLNSVDRGAMTARTYDYYGASGVIDKVDDYLFDDELLLIAEDGANLVLRNLPLAIIARGKFWVNNHAHILKPRRGSIIYLAHVLETLTYKPWISGAAQPKLTQDRLMSISIAVSPPAEQAVIVEHTSEQTRPLVTAISRLEREIELLCEYRTRLVADVVTGKLDVREAALRLSDEAPLDTTDNDSDLGDHAEAADEEAVA